MPQGRWITRPDHTRTTGAPRVLAADAATGGAVAHAGAVTAGTGKRQPAAALPNGGQNGDRGLADAPSHCMFIGFAPVRDGA